MCGSLQSRFWREQLAIDRVLSQTGQQLVVAGPATNCRLLQKRGFKMQLIDLAKILELSVAE